MKVYIVTSGSYSDYGIDAVFSTPEMAQKYINEGIEFGEDKNEKSIEEYELDRPPEQWVVTRITMTRDGTTTEVKKIYNGDDGLRYLTEDSITWGVNTNDTERAVKVVNEKRTQIIALNLWPAPFYDLKKMYERIKEAVK